MPSLRSKIITWNLKRTVKSQPLHELEPELLRTEFKSFAPKKPPRDVTQAIVEEGAIRGEWHKPKISENGRTILYFHGGGYYFGSAEAYRGLTYALARECKADVFSLDYRQAPEDPYPAAVEDAVAAYQWLLANGRDPKNINIMGDSAGGGLSIALLLALKERGIQMPAGAVIYSPWADMSVSGASIDENNESDAMFTKPVIIGGAEKYLAGADPKSPLASPIFGDLAGLPPINIYASADEILRDDAVRLHERLQEAGVQSTLTIEKGLTHIWPLYVGKMPEAIKTIRETATFIGERTGAS